MGPHRGRNVLVRSRGGHPSRPNEIAKLLVDDRQSRTLYKLNIGDFPLPNNNIEMSNETLALV
jgi:hypothetical protein